MKSIGFKRLIIEIAFLVWVVSLFQIKTTGAYLSDLEKAEGNKFTAGILDLGISSGQGNFVPDTEDLKPGDSVARDIYVIQQPGSMPLKHKASYQFVDGNEDLCGQLELKIWYNHYHGPVSGGYANRDMRLKYQGPLSALSGLEDGDFIIPHPDDWYDDDHPGTQWFYYHISVPGDLDESFMDSFCQFDFNFIAWQENLPDSSLGLTDSEQLESTIMVDDWTRPSSEITSTEDLVNTQAFGVDYEAEDNAIDYVELWYSFNYGDWQYFGDDVPSSPGSFDFTSPGGDGVYEFITVVVDQSGNVEDKNGNDVDDNTELDLVAGYLGVGIYQVQVDSEVPYTVLSLGEFWDDDDVVGNRFAVNELMVNGNFEDTSDPERGWVWGGTGEHQTVDDADLGLEAEVKAGDNSGLIGWFDDDPIGDGQDYVYQVVSLPSDPSTLSFWYQVISEDTVDYDWFEAKVIDDSGILAEETIIKTGSDEVGGWSGDSLWREATHSLAGWANQTIQVWFGVTNHDELGWPLRTFALIDDVRITNSDNFVTTDKEMELANNDVGSGVETTYYQVDGGGWQEYIIEFDLGGEGVGSGESVEVEYYSVDLAGNMEATRSLELTTDDGKDYFGVVLNEFMANPVGADDASMTNGEWVELYNNSSIDIDVGGWVLYDNDDSHPLPITDFNTDTGDTRLAEGY